MTARRTENAASTPPEVRKPLIAIPESNWPRDLGVNMPDSLLLRPESGVVPFHDYRKALLEEILGWALTPQPRIAVRLQAGEGGAGKTRMMIEVCRRLVRDEGWHAGFLSSGDGASGDLAAELSCGKPCLIVLDYAETRRAEIVTLTRTALGIPGGPQIRIMLLAREGGDWWDQLADGAADHPVAASVLRSPSTKTGPYRMTKGEVPLGLRPEVFAAALRALAQTRGEPVPEAEPPDLSAAHFGNILLIHFAALARLRGYESNRDIELMDATLGHERRYWELLVSGDPDAGVLLPALEQALALITLLGGTRTATDTKALLAETPHCRGTGAANELTGRLFTLLRRLYPQEGGVSTLQPDLLGERLVARAVAQDDELLDIALARGRAPEEAKNAFTVLTRLANRDPSQEAFLKRALDRHLADHLTLSLEVGSETGAPMPEIIAETVRGKPKANARQIMMPLLQAISEGTTNLQALAAAIAQINIDLLGDKAKKKHGTKIKVQLLSGYEEAASRFEAVGDWARAVDARQHALEQIRSLHKTGNNRDLVRISGAQLNLASALARVGKFEQALKQGAAAERGFRQLARRQPDAHHADWARSLSNLATHLGQLGRFKEAIDKARAAEQIRRELAKRQPDAHRADWARSLHNLGNRLSDLGRLEEAIDKARAAEQILGELAERQPDAYLTDWSWALTVLAESRLGSKGFATATTLAGQAIQQFQQVGSERLRTHDDWVGWAHRVRAEALLGSGNLADASAEATESIAILRGVFDQRPSVAAEKLAKAALVQARCLRKLDRPDEGASALSECLTLLLPLTDRKNARLRRILGDMLGELGEIAPHLLQISPALEMEASLKQPWAAGS